MWLLQTTVMFEWFFFMILLGLSLDYFAVWEVKNLPTAWWVIVLHISDGNWDQIFEKKSKIKQADLFKNYYWVESSGRLVILEKNSWGFFKGQGNNKILSKSCCRSYLRRVAGVFLKWMVLLVSWHPLDWIWQKPCLVTTPIPRPGF